MAFSIVVSWEPSTDYDIAGYNISYDTPTSDRWSTPCDPYEVSSIGIPLVYDETEYVYVHTTTYTIEDASTGIYAVYIRAYDYTGLMSDYTPYAFNVASDGEGGYTVSTVGISEPGDCLPVASIAEIATTTGLAPFEVSFSGSCTNNPTSWAWDFDRDGVDDATTQNASYTYNTGGIAYYPKLRVYNSLWFSDAFSEILTTLPPIVPATLQGVTISGGSFR